MNIEIDQEIQLDRNSEGHTVDAELTLSHEGKKIGTVSVRHLGLSGCGEAFFSEVSFSPGFPELLRSAAVESAKDFAHKEMKKWWDYDGSNWSAPVEELDEELDDE